MIKLIISLVQISVFVSRSVSRRGHVWTDESNKNATVIFDDTTPLNNYLNPLPYRGLSGDFTLIDTPLPNPLLFLSMPSQWRRAAVIGPPPVVSESYFIYGGCHLVSLKSLQSGLIYHDPQPLLVHRKAKSFHNLQIPYVKCSLLSHG